MDEDLRQRVLEHPDDYPDEYLRQAAEASESPADKEKMRRHFSEKLINRREAAQMILAHSQGEIEPVLSRMQERIAALERPWYKRAYDKIGEWFG